MPPIPSPRFLFGMGEAESSIFVIGGKELKEGEETLDSVLVYNRQWVFNITETCIMMPKLQAFIMSFISIKSFQMGRVGSTSLCGLRPWNSISWWNCLCNRRKRREQVSSTWTNALNFLTFVSSDTGPSCLACRQCLNRVCAYDTKKGEWKDLAPLKTERSLFGVTVYKDKIYVAGGVTETGLTGTMEVYDIKSNKSVQQNDT